MSKDEIISSKLFVKRQEAHNTAYIPITHDQKIIHIACNGDYTFFADETNSIFKINKDFTKEQIKLDNNNTQLKKIKFFLAGFYHLIVINEDHEDTIFGLGRDTEGQLNGLSVFGELNELKIICKKNQFIDNMTDLNIYNNNYNITHACCGTYSTVIVINESDIYYCGQLENMLSTQFELIPLPKLNNDSNFNNNNSNNNNYRIKKISCGYGHLLVLTSDGQLFGLGSNVYGQALYSSNKNNHHLSKVILNENEDINILEAIAIPLSHISALITSQLDILIYGYFGQTLANCFSNKKQEGRVKLNQIEFTKNVKELDNSKCAFPCYKNYKIDKNIKEEFHYGVNDIKICGGFTKLVIVDKLRKKIWLGGSANNFTDECYNLKEVDKNLFISNSQEEILDVSCGSNVIAYLIGRKNTMNAYTLKNLRKMVECCKEKEKYLFDMEFLFL